MLRNKTGLIAVILIVAAVAGYLVYNYYQEEKAEAAKSQANTTILPKESEFLLTIFLKHDQSKTLVEIQKKLNETGFYSNFPPKGTSIESWKVVMGIGQVITLRVPPSKLRDVNVALERMAWGSFRTEFYPSYDFVPVYNSYRDSASIDTTVVVAE